MGNLIPSSNSGRIALSGRGPVRRPLELDGPALGRGRDVAAVVRAGGGPAWAPGRSDIVSLAAGGSARAPSRSASARCSASGIHLTASRSPMRI